MYQYITKVSQNIIDKDLKIKSWGKSSTRLIPNVNIPAAKQLTPIALTDVSYKLFMPHLLDNNKKLTDWFHNRKYD